MYILLQNQGVESIPVCRLCGIQSLELSYLDTFDEAGRYMVFAVQKYLNIEMSEKEIYPRNVCLNCSRKIEEWNNFYNKCQEIQTLLKSTPLLLDQTVAISHQEESTEISESVSNHLSKLVEEFVQDGTMSNDKTQLEASVPLGNLTVENPEAESEDKLKTEDNGAEEDTNFTEDEFEDVMTSGDESGNRETQNEEMKNRLRHKKFTFTIPFLERKVDKKFTPTERIKLQKHISKRQNTMIYEMLVGGGPSQLWQCQICQKSIKGRVSEIKKHYLKVHQAQPIYPCHACDYTSRTEKMYQAHRMSHLVEYPCQHCGKIFTQHSRLVYHMNSHTNQRQFECDLCHKKFNTAQYVTTHKRKVHGDQEKLLKYTCELCGMRFKYKNHLQYHQKRHPTDENPLPYNCKYCEQRFTSRAEQLAHSNTIHAGEGDYVCHLCGKKMKTILSLENHVKLHSGLKEFKCQCGAAFATNHSLKCHQKIHLRQDNSYLCPVCKKAMSNKSSLNQHMKTHMGTKPYQCQHCSSSYVFFNSKIYFNHFISIFSLWFPPLQVHSQKPARYSHEEAHWRIPAQLSGLR